MDIDFVDFVGRALWACVIFFYLVAAAISFYRSKVLLGAGFALLFLVGMFNWLFVIFVNQWVMNSYDGDPSTFFQVKWIMVELVTIVSWVVVCAGLYTGLAPKAE